ncbi:MAG TPA: intradiol ring-cleavage dioxygenase [Beijerinckiaceae bacterium]|nr:intradiol ring-cleavage dioxygenase [Beijerinckiaceae bacterium]
MAGSETRESAYFTESNSAEVVIGRMGPAVDPRLREIVSAVIRHLHALVKEVEPTQQEWMEAIRFLTETGHMCNEWRQEFILLSDTLGVSMLVDAINNRKPSGATESTVLGPFHVAGAPRHENGADIRLDGKGERLVVSGRVTDIEGRRIPGATLDIWQANNEGFYDVQQKDVQPSMNLRGLFTTDADGRYWFRTAKPRYYSIPDDGPVGKLLRQTGRHPYRPAHVHFIVAADGYQSVVTHIFPPDCPYLESDAVFGVKQSLIGDFREIDDAARAEDRRVEAPFWELEANFVLVREDPKSQ